MDTETIIAELEAEVERLNEAIAALQATGNGRRRGARRGRRQLSAEARKRISDAMRKNWAKRKRAGAA